jgi:hypothetical protein
MTNPFATATNPFGGNTEAQSTENTMTEEVKPAETAEATENNSEEKTTKKRQRHVEKNAKRKTGEQVKYILSNYKDNSVSDLLKDPFLEGLTEQQIRKTVFDAKKALKEQAESIEDEDKKAKLLAWIEENLPNRSGEKKSGKRGTVMDSALDDIMSSVFG